MTLNFPLAEKVAALATEIDDEKENWPQYDQMQAFEVVEDMHKLAATLAGHRAAEIYDNTEGR